MNLSLIFLAKYSNITLLTSYSSRNRHNHSCFVFYFPLSAHYDLSPGVSGELDCQRAGWPVFDGLRSAPLFCPCFEWSDLKLWTIAFFCKFRIFQLKMGHQNRELREWKLKEKFGKWYWFHAILKLSTLQWWRRTRCFLNAWTVGRSPLLNIIVDIIVIRVIIGYFLGS